MKWMIQQHLNANDRCFVSGSNNGRLYIMFIRPGNKRYSFFNLKLIQKNLWILNVNTYQLKRGER